MNFPISNDQHELMKPYFKEKDVYGIASILYHQEKQSNIKQLT